MLVIAHPAWIIYAREQLKKSDIIMSFDEVKREFIDFVETNRLDTEFRLDWFVECTAAKFNRLKTQVANPNAK